MKYKFFKQLSENLKKSNQLQAMLYVHVPVLSFDLFRMTKYKYKASMQFFESYAVKMGVQKQKFKTED